MIPLLFGGLVGQCAPSKGVGRPTPFLDKKVSVSPPGQKRHFDSRPVTSGLPRSTDIFRVCRHAPNVPEPELARILGGLFFLEKSRMVGRPGLPRGKRSDQADDPREWSFCDYSLIHPPQVLWTTFLWSSNRSSPRLPRQEVASGSMCRRDISSLRLPVRRRSYTFQ
jgi:hypothetical protein